MRDKSHNRRGLSKEVLPWVDDMDLFSGETGSDHGFSIDIETFLAFGAAEFGADVVAF